MGRVFKNIILGVLILAVSQSLALDSEYKNSLNKIELVKTGENSYNVNLYTQKSYAQAPRVIKKSDYNYYILLPETKNSAPAASRNAQDISSVSANLYPYAGQDINNGYTKININTTKPIAFKLNVKNSASKVVQSSQSKTAIATSKPTEKKTSLATTSSKNSPAKINKTKLQPKQVIIPKTAQTQNQNTKKLASKSNNIVVAPKQTAKTPAPAKTQTKTQTKAQTKVQDKVTAKAPVKVANKPSSKATTATKQAQKPVTKPVAPKAVQKPKAQPKVAPSPSNQEEDIQKHVSLPDDSTTKTPTEKASEPVEDIKATVSQGDIFVPMANNADIEDDEMFKDEYDESNDNKFIAFYKNIVSTITDKKNNLEEKLSAIGTSLSDILWMILIGLLSLYIVFKILTRKHPQAKLRNKSEFKDKKRKAPAQKKKGQYFIFDKNIKQTEFKDPNDPNKNYELEPYSPDNTLKYNKTQDAPASKPNYNLYEANDLGDIIEKAQEIEQGKDKVQVQKEQEAESKVIENFGLSEDALELYKDEENKENQEAQAPTAPAPIKKEVQKQGLQQRLEETEIIEPKVSKENEIQNEIPGLKVLSKVEIAPERGFMCVSYNDNINLIGYIFDDVFALHNFKMPKLQNYDIRFRLSERDNKGAYFIVKIDNTKLLIKVTRTSMALEVVM